VLYSYSPHPHSSLHTSTSRRLPAAPGCSRWHGRWVGGTFSDTGISPNSQKTDAIHMTYNPNLKHRVRVMVSIRISSGELHVLLISHHLAVCMTFLLTTCWRPGRRPGLPALRQVRSNGFSLYLTRLSSVWYS